MNRKEFLFFAGTSVLGLSYAPVDSIGYVGQDMVISWDQTGEYREPVGGDANNYSERYDRLKEYVDSIRDEKDRLLPIVESNNMFNGFKNITLEKQTEDFNMYFPIYKAGEIKYGIPWYLLWISHFQETGASSHPNPEEGGYLGGMQRSGYFYKDQYVDDAVDGWDFLSCLPQRYKIETGNVTSDFREIMFAAKKMRLDADVILDNNPNLGFEEAVMLAQFKYCAAYCAKERAKRYYLIKPLLSDS